MFPASTCPAPQQQATAAGGSQLTTSPDSMLPLLEEQMSAFERTFCGGGQGQQRMKSLQRHGAI